MVDTTYQVETPEGLHLEFALAGPIIRGVAWFIDALIRIGVVMAAFFVLAYLGEMGLGLGLLIWFLIEWFYPVLFEVFRHGATPGKSAMGLQVIQDDGTPVHWGPSLIRNLLRAADFLPALYTFGVACMLIDRQFRRFGDLAAGTLVVHRQRLHQVRSVPSETPQAPVTPLTAADQRAIISFAERVPMWSDERACELAEILEPITHRRGEAAVRHIVGVANYLIGRR